MFFSINLELKLQRIKENEDVNHKKRVFEI